MEMKMQLYCLASAGRHIIALHATSLAVCIFASGCGSQQQVSHKSEDQPPVGLYEVTHRVCEKPPGDPSSCPITQYIELVRGNFYGIGPNETAFVLWLATERDSSNYTYEARPLRGARVAAEMYVIDEYPGVKEWLTLEHGAIRGHSFLAYRAGSKDEVLVRSQLSLRAVSRTPEINQRLPYPGAAE
jgi:hypothetical protein